MESFELPPDEEYDKQCGEVFLTTNGTLLFHCTLCENRFKGYENYAQHIIEIHFEPAFLDQQYSDMSDDDIKIEPAEDECDDALIEEEIPMSIIKQKNADNKIMTAVQVISSDETASKEVTYKWEEALKVETQIERPSESKKVTSTMPVCQVAPKPITMSEKIRIANEKASQRKVPLFQQPVPKKNIPDSERKHKCNFCGFAFKDPSNLIAHIKRHSKEKNYQCAYCIKMFCTRTEVEEHTRRHTGEKPFVCTFENCTKSYCASTDLTNHMKRHLNQRNHKCEICDRRFFDKKHLKEHMVSHTKERNHECMVCNAKFSRRIALTNHLKLHENKREYMCELCDASFNQKPGLYSHMKSKHKM